MKRIVLFLVYMTSYIIFGQTENMNFEQGDFSNWNLEVGVRTSPTEEDFNTPFPFDINEHIRLMNPGVPPLDEYGVLCSTPDIPSIFPGGLFSARLGNNPGGRVASKMSRTFVVDPNQTFLQYSYAIVLEEPGHSQEEQPKFVVNIKDSNGMIVTCGKFEAFAGPNAADQGFVGCDMDREYRCDFPITECADSPNAGPDGWPVQILPWTSGGADLTPFIGQQITVEFLTLDCLLGAHGATAYVEANLEPLEIQVSGLCASGDDITLSAPIGFVSYLWSTGETTREIQVTNAQYGDTFTVQLVSNTGCDTSTSITLEPKPDAMIDAIEDQTICRGANAIITPTGIDAFNFYFPDVDFTGLSIVLSPDMTTTYTVIALNENGCQGESTTFTIEVLEGDGPIFPEAAFEMEPIIDANNTCNTVQFTNLSGYCKDDLEYVWDFGDGSPISTEENPTHTFPTTATQETYTITLTVTSISDGLSDTTSQTFNSGGVTPSFDVSSNCAVVTITNTSMVCNTSFEDFTNFTYSWDFGDGSPAVVTDETQVTFDYTYTSSSAYTITLTMEDLTSGTVYTETNIIEVTAGLQADFESIDNECFNVFFRDLSTSCDPILSYEWDFGDGSPINTETSPTHTYTSEGPHTVTLTVNDGTSSEVYSEDITLTPISVTPGFTYEQICNDLIFTNTTESCVENMTYSWDFGDGSPVSTEMNPTHFFEFGNTYTVVLTVNDGTQDYTFSQTIEVNKEFIFVAPEDMQVCSAPGEVEGAFNLASQTTIILANVPPGTIDFPVVTYHLTQLDAMDGVNNVNTDFISTQPLQPIYVRVAESDNCFEIFTFNLILNQTPGINPIEDIFLCTMQGNSLVYDLLQLNQSLLEGMEQNDINLTYHETSEDAELDQNPITSINLVAGVDVTIFVRAENVGEEGCHSLLQFNIRLDNQETGEGNRCFLIFSNAMTPNGDGSNDTFIIDNIDAYPNNEIIIYNRWGNVVYRASGYNNTWNGTRNGKPLPVATYYYVLELNDISKQRHSGYISIIK